jgi:hypothetical protein
MLHQYTGQGEEITSVSWMQRVQGAAGETGRAFAPTGASAEACN